MPLLMNNIQAYGLLDAMKILENELIVIKRDEKDTIIPYQTHLDKVSKDEIYFRYG